MKDSRTLPKRRQRKSLGENATHTGARTGTKDEENLHTEMTAKHAIRGSATIGAVCKECRT